MEDTKWARRLSHELVDQVFKLKATSVTFKIDTSFKTTTCVIHLPRGKGIGVSICSTLDKFDEIVGKEESLERAKCACENGGRDFEIRDTWDKFPNSWTKRQIDRVKNVANYIIPAKSMFMTVH